MDHRRAALVLAVVLGLAAPSSAAESLATRIKAFLTGKQVYRARRVTAVAAVRGSAPKDQEEDLDQTLLDAVAVQRAAAAPDARTLRRLYEALGVSYAVQAYASSEDQDARGEAYRALTGWAREPRVPAPPASLVSVLSSPTAGLDEKTLVRAGWGRYVRSIIPGKTEAAKTGAAPAVDAETAALEEQLESLRDAWLTRALEESAKTQAYVLASQVCAALGKAPWKFENAADKASVEVAAALPESTEASVEFVPRKVYDSASRSVVAIIASEPGGSGEMGTGSVVDAQGRVLTNAHVVIRESTRQPWPKIRVYLKPARMSGDPKQDLNPGYAAKVVAHDRALDLALLELEGAPKTPALALADPPTVDIGDRVAAIGHPEQGGLWTLTTGVLSSLVADIGGIKGKHVFQTDASINRGNSGGPLLDARGRIVGVNTLMSRKAADGLAITSVNFAVRSDVAAKWLKNKAGAEPVVAAAPPARAVPVSSVLGGSWSSGAGSGGGGSSASRAPAKPAPAPKKITITESKPFSRDELIEREIREMEDLENEMKEEIRKRR